jgi:hypothetical protein
MPVRELPISPVLPVSRGTFRDHDDCGQARRRQPLPLGHLAPAPSSRLVYGLARVDRNGRIADRNLMDTLGWRPRTRLDIREAHGALRVAAADNGVLSRSP